MELPDVEIRPLRIDDLPKFLGLLKHLNGNDIPPDVARKVFWELAPRSIWVFVAEFKGLLIGTATLDVDQHFIHKGGKVGRIEDVVVAPKYREAGIGSLLIKRCVETAREAGCYKGILSCNEANVPFYEKNGFRVHEVSMRYDF